jgi:hypothetical protein
MLRSFSLALVLLLTCLPTFGQTPAEFKSVASFLASLGGAESRAFAEGDLFGTTGKDWAGVVVSTGEDEEEIAEVYILENLPSGAYRVTGKSAARPASGGTGNFYFENISIENKIVSVAFSYHWHSCAGNSESRFKLTRQGWQLIGIDSFETNSVEGTGIALKTSSNFLTGAGIVEVTAHGKRKVSRIRERPRLILLKAYNGDGTISVYAKSATC